MKYVFNDFSLDTKSRLLSKGDITFKLEPKVFELLLYFCQRPKQAISREQLIIDVWQNRIVSYAAINRAVGELRKVIEEHVVKPKIIITVSKIGYLFDGKVIIESDSASSEGASLIFNEKQNKVKPDVTAVKPEPGFLSDDNNVNHALKISQPKKKILTLILLAITVVMFIISLVSWRESTYKSPPRLSIEKPLTALKGTSFKGDLSTTGHDLVFLHKENPNDVVQVWLKKQGEIAKELTLDDYYYTYVIFADTDFVLASRFNNLDERQCEIVKISLLDKRIEKVFDCAPRAITNLSYSPSTSTVYFNYRRSITSAFNIYAYQLATQSLQQLTFTDITAAQGDFTLALPPSEDQLAVLEYRDKHQAILKFIQLDRQDKTVTFGPEFNANSRISWLSEHQVLLADGERIHLYDLRTQETSVLGGNTSIGFAKAHAATKQIIFDKGKVIANIYQYPLKHQNSLNKSNKEAVTNSSFINYQMQFANLSKNIVYFSTDSGEYEILIKPEGAREFSTNFPEKINVITNVDWSGSDKFLVAGVTHQIYLYDIDKEVWRLLLAQEDNIHYVHFIDDTHVAFSSKQSGQWQIWQMNLDSQRVKQITSKGGYSVQTSNNKNFYYLTKYNSPGIFKLDLLTGAEEVVLPQHKVTSWKKWQLRDQKLYYIKQQTLHQLDLETQSDILASTFEFKAPASFSISYDHSVMQRELVESSSANIWLTQVE